MQKCVLFDIDGTVADLSHRKHFVMGAKKDWKSFLSNIKDDLPIAQTIFLNKLINAHTDMPVIMASGRSEDERIDTVDWLATHGVSYEHLYMRKAGDYRADYIIKLELLAQMRADGYEPWLVIDDRPQVVEAWRNAGLFVLQCDPEGCDTKHDEYLFAEWCSDCPLTIMVGPSGAGKDTFLNSFSFKESDPGIVISSDNLRTMICGDFTDQSQNARVFYAMHRLAETRLKLGLPVILNATHIKRADRIKAAKLVPEHIPVDYVVINRPLKEKLATAGWRESVVLANGKSLVEAHDQTFKSNLKDILNGDGLPNVRVCDLRKE